MDIMMRLSGAGFSAIANEFRDREKRLGGGLPLLDFVEIVLQGLPRGRTAEEKAANVSALIDLFEDIDINGDGAMEFDEFTSFCVDAGMVATRMKATTLKHRYVRDTKHIVKTANGSNGIEKIKWSPEFRKFMVIENPAKVVKLFNHDGKFITEVGSAIPAETSGSGASGTTNSKSGTNSNNFEETSRSGRGSSSEGNGGTAADGTSTRAGNFNERAAASTPTTVFVLDAVFVAKFNWLAMSTTDFCISFFDMDESRHSALGVIIPEIAAKSTATFELIKRLTITTTTAQLMMRYCDSSNVLVSSGNDFVINMWKIVDSETKVLWKRLISHQDMVMDFMEVPQHDLFVSCDLRRSIQLWENQNCRSRGSLVGHTRGVRQIVYSSHHDLLLSAGFEFEAYAWDLGSRQIVMKLSGHRAPLVGIQLALFQNERAITADCQGVFKVWDITRNSGQFGGASASSKRGPVGSATQAIQLESIEPSIQFARFEPMTFICLHPYYRDVWTSTAGSSTLHRFQSKRIQQFDEIPLSGFYHYNANKFVVVTGSVCSIWDGETGTCTEEFTHVGNVGADFDRETNSSGAGSGGGGAGSSNNNHTSADSSQSAEPCSEVFLCAHDSKCRKLVAVSELGFMGVFNCLNFVEMRQCIERFGGNENKTDDRGTLRGPSCHIVGLHYCSDNRLIIATDASTSAILVIDDNVSHDPTNGTKRTPVLRRLINIPGGISASAYSYHASMVATVAEADGMVISLWDFETLALVAQCHLEAESDGAVPARVEEETGCIKNRVHQLQFWDEFPVLFAADARGLVYVLAVMPLIHAYAGKLLHVFTNAYDSLQRASSSVNLASSSQESGNQAMQPKPTDATTTTSRDESTTFLTEAAEGAAHRLLLRSRQMRSGSISGLSRSASDVQAASSNKATASLLSRAITSMKVVFDDASERYILFTGDEYGCVTLWDLSSMMRRLKLTKIPEIKCKYLRRGYHPKATFARDYAKEGKSMELTQRKHHQPVFQGDWRRSMMLGEDMAEMDVRATQMDRKRLSRRRVENQKRPSAVGSVANAADSSSKRPLSGSSASRPANSISRSTTPAPDDAVDTAVAAAEAFLGGQRRKSTRNMPEVSALRPQTTSAQPAGVRGVSDPSRGCVASDVTVVSRWQAHSDAVTSLEVTRNPHIVVTCSLDTRVFVWDWHGSCQGKLFDTDNDDSCDWRFRKNDAKRQQERNQLVNDLIRELELTSHEKLQRRRQTLYDEHVGRRSQAELKHVNAMLLDHIISKNPELEIMERAVNRTLNANGGTSSGDHLSDAEINSALEQSRLRNSRAKLNMLVKLQDSTSSKPKIGGRSFNMLELVEQKKNMLRMQSLSQVGPLLCVDKFDYDSRSTEAAPTFSDQTDVRMDKAYFEQELTITSESAKDALDASTVAAVQEQIHAEHVAAEAFVEHRETLQRKARELYTNLEATKMRLGKEKRPPLDSTPVEGTVDVLEPSDFLRRHLSSSVLSTRPRTAPVRSTTRKSKQLPNPAALPPAKSGKTPNAHTQVVRNAVKTKPSQSLEAPNASTLRPSESEPVLGSQQNVQRPSTASSRITSFHRRSSLDELFLGEVNRQNLSPMRVKLDEEGHPLKQSENAAGGGGANNNTKSSLQKLAGINDIISKVQDYSVAMSKDENNYRLDAKTRRSSGLTSSSQSPSPPVNSSRIETQSGETPADLDSRDTRVAEDVVRLHLEATKERMMIAMNDVEWSTSHRQVMKKQRDMASRKKKAQRMEGYLQQKRRELNTNIGNVFKNTSFAFQSNANEGSNVGRKGGMRSPGHKGSTTEKHAVFGIYSVREVMSVIRLFWMMDEDGSGNISLSELLEYQQFFEKLGYNDMQTVFQAIDKDGNGQVSLKELLETCFHYATKYQLDEMLKLAKIGNVREFLHGGADDGSDNGGNGQDPGAPTNSWMLPEHKLELLEIFHVFDRNGDGGVSIQEIMEALRVDDDDIMASIMVKEQRKKRAGSAILSSGLTKPDVQQLYREFDRDSNGELDFDEFVALMKCLYGPRVNPNAR